MGTSLFRGSLDWLPIVIGLLPLPCLSVVVSKTLATASVPMTSRIAVSVSGHVFVVMAVPPAIPTRISRRMPAVPIAIRRMVRVAVNAGTRHVINPCSARPANPAVARQPIPPSAVVITIAPIGPLVRARHPHWLGGLGDCVRGCVFSGLPKRPESHRQDEKSCRNRNELLQHSKSSSVRYSSSS